MTKRKVTFGLLSLFACFLLATILMVLSGFLPVRVWLWVVLIGLVVYSIVLLTFTRNQ